jgi:hypothetical protein
MQDVVFKIEQTLDLAVPFVILVLSVFGLAGVVQWVDKASPVLYGLLALAQGVFKIWGIALRAQGKAGPETPKAEK